jgi:hypothetical protein
MVQPERRPWYIPYLLDFKSMREQKLVSHISISTINDVKEILKIRDIWSKMQIHYNADIDFYLTVIESRALCKPHIFVMRSGEDVVGMLIGRIEDSTFPLKVGYKSIFEPKVRTLIIVHGGILGKLCREAYDELAVQFMALLKNHDVDLIHFELIPDNSGLIASIEHFLFQVRVPIAHWIMRARPNVTNLLMKMTSKHRNEINRLGRILERDFHGSIRFKYFLGESDITELFTDVEMVARQTYQRGLGVGFSYNDFMRRRLSLSARKGWLRAVVLYIDEIPRSYWIGSAYKETFYLEFTGYDPMFYKYELGTIVLMKMLERIFSEGPDLVDFGFGDALYKKRFADYRPDESSIYIFAPTAKGKSIYLLNALFFYGARYSKSVLDKFHIREKVKKFWRNSLANKR